MAVRDRSAADFSKLVWKKSSHSGPNGGQCVEVASNLPGKVAVRDSKNPMGFALLLTSEEWGAFLNDVKSGRIE